VCRGSPEEPCYEPDVIARDRSAEACTDIDAFRPPTYRTRENDKEVLSMPDWPAGWRLDSVCESLLLIDRMVGDLVEAQAARDRPAYFLLTSDHGMAWGQKGFVFKHVPASTRQPLYVAGPGVPAGASSDALLSNIDIAPTLAALASAEMAWADGISFEAALAGDPFDGRAELLEYMPRATGDYEGWAAVRTPGARYIRWDGGDQELYDLGRDPWEQADEAETMPEVAASMAARLDELMASVLAPAPDG
jgi:arylsulfatase A-like enzyme